MEENEKFTKKYFKYSSVGFELAGGVAVFCLIGYFIDERMGTSPVGLITGAILGIIGGVYLLIKQALIINKTLEKDQADERRTEKPTDEQ
jgi:F0F1-type ATP synthase assembly protein I